MKTKILQTKARLENRYRVSIHNEIVDFIIQLHIQSEDGSGVVRLPQIVRVNWHHAGEEGFELFMEYYSWVSRDPEFTTFRPECATEIELAHDRMLNPENDVQSGPRIPPECLYLAGSASGSRLLVRPDGKVLLSLFDFEELGDPLGCCEIVGNNWSDFLRICKPWTPS